MTENALVPGRASWRFPLGIACFIGAFAIYLVTAAAVLSSASPRTVGIIAAVNFTLNKVLLVASAVLLGKAGFTRLKRMVFGTLQRHLMPDEVAPWRYRIGLVLFLVPLVFAWKAPYIVDLMPSIGRHSLELAVISDVMFLISLFVLGGGFWDKLRALFVREARAVFPVDRQ